MDNIEFQNKVALAKLMNELRHSPPMGVVGLMEFRNLLANLFPEFEEVRDEELDKLLTDYIEDTVENPTAPEPDLENYSEKG